MVVEFLSTGRVVFGFFLILGLVLSKIGDFLYAEDTFGVFGFPILRNLSEFKQLSMFWKERNRADILPDNKLSVA